MDDKDLQLLLEELRREHDVPGTTVALAVGDDLAVAADGVLNRRTSHPVTPDSVFHLGSITKTWTATLVAGLVDDLDQPISALLPELAVVEGVTVRRLLTHTSGLLGDHLVDTGRGDDCLERYVATLADLPTVHAPGAAVSYCNSGFVVLGRLVEVLTGQTWDAALQERVIAPLGLAATGTLPEQAVLHAAAVGHHGGQVTPAWTLPRALGPAGAVHGPAHEVVAYARRHLADPQWASLHERQVEIPGPGILGTAVGLSWMLWEDWGRPAFGHDGDTIGQSALLRVLPAHEGRPAVVLVAMSNGGDMHELHRRLAATLLAEHGATVPSAWAPPTEPVSVGSEGLLGAYGGVPMTYSVQDRDGTLTLVTQASGAMAAALGATELEAPLVALAPGAFLTQLPGLPGWTPAAFAPLPDGRQCLYVAGRANPAVR